MKTNETIINIYITDDDIQNNFNICRPDYIDEDDYQERCDETDMSNFDIDIANITKGNINYSVFTSCDRWNVYLCKEKWLGDKTPTIQDINSFSWEVHDMTNITSDIDDWENIQDLTNYLLSLKFKEPVGQHKNIVEFLENKIRKDEAILSDAYWLDTITFYVSFAFSPDELRQYFHNIIDDKDGDCYLSAEYHEDEHKFVYELIFDEDKLNMDEYIQSTIIDWYILEQARKF